MQRAAFCAAMQDHKALAGIGLHADGLHLPAALVGAVAGIDIHVQTPQAEGAMVAGAVAKGLDLLAAVRANEPIIVF